MSLPRVCRLFRAVAVISLAVLWVSGASPALCAPVGSSQAQSAATGWLRLNPEPFGAAHDSRIALVETHSEDDGDPLYYTVQLAPEGFLILAADDDIEPVICFAPSGSFDQSPGNPLAGMLTVDLSSRLAGAQQTMTLFGAESSRGEEIRAKWAMLIGAATSDTGMGPMSARSVSDPRVSPIVESQWSQEDVSGLACYNYYTPPGPAGSAENYPSGCVATAMAQLMRFHHYPTAGVGSAAFTVKVDGVSQSRSLRGGDGWGGPYDYANAVACPDDLAATDERRAIGAICHDAGVAASMEYTASASSTSLDKACVALRNTFGYANAVFGHNSGRNIDGGLVEMINPNLDAGLPVMISARDAQDQGHAMVCDGYGYNGDALYHHLNMGWAGLGDTWYNLPEINTASYSFNLVDQCVYNVFTSGTGEIISGRVTCAGSPSQGAIVTAQRSGGGTYSASTSADGIYALTGLPANSGYTVTVARSGYTFASRTTSTGRSADFSSVSGNKWGIDFAGTLQADTTNPTCTVTGPSSPTSVYPIRFHVRFSEPVQSLAAADLELAGAYLGVATGSGTDFDVTANPEQTGDVTLRVPAGVAFDAAGNPNLASNALAVHFVDPPPTITITGPASSCTRNQPELHIKGNARDNSSIQSVSWSSDRGGGGQCDGLEQWSTNSITLARGRNVITVTATDSASKTGSASVTVDYIPSLPGDAWHGAAMVALPIVPDITEPLGVAGFEGNGWYSYESGIGYAQYPDTRTWFVPAESTPGRGFWAYFPADGPTTTPRGAFGPQDTPFTFHLMPGWNLIGQPFYKPADWNETAITVRASSGDAKPLKDSRDIVANYAWGWDAAKGEYYLVCDPSIALDATSQLQPWQAYWVKAYKECDLILPPR